MEKSPLEEKLTANENDALKEFQSTPYQVFKIQFPYTARFTIPDDDNNTEVVINTVSQQVYYARNETEVKHQHELATQHSKESLCKYIRDYVFDELWKSQPENEHFEITGEPNISVMTENELEEFKMELLSAYNGRKNG